MRIPALVLALWIPLGVSAAAPVPLGCSLETIGEYRIGAEVSVQVCVYNQAGSAVRLLKWYTPWEGFFSRLFRVTAPDGGELPYLGPMAKRLTPGEDDYISVDPGARLCIRLDLSRAFAFRQPGLHQVTPLFPLDYTLADGEAFRHTAVDSGCAPVDIQLLPQGAPGVNDWSD